MEEDIIINELEQLIEKSKNLREEEFYTIFTIHEVQNIRAALNLIQKQQTQIDEMAKFLGDLKLSKDREGYEIMEVNDWKQYFEKEGVNNEM